MTGWADPSLTKFTCVTLIVRSSVDDQPITDQDLHDALFVVVKVKLPHLPVHGFCSRLVLDVDLMTITSGHGKVLVGQSGRVSLSVQRYAVIQDINAPVNATAWEARLQFIALPGEVKTNVLRTLDELITRFAADYYRAGNP